MITRKKSRLDFRDRVVMVVELHTVENMMLWRKVTELLAINNISEGEFLVRSFREYIAANETNISMTKDLLMEKELKSAISVVFEAKYGNEKRDFILEKLNKFNLCWWRKSKTLRRGADYYRLKRDRMTKFRYFYRLDRMVAFLERNYEKELQGELPVVDAGADEAAREKEAEMRRVEAQGQISIEGLVTDGEIFNRL